jgi:hypothetical protein
MRRLRRLLVNGVGLGWRPETAWLIERRTQLGFSEVIAENVNPAKPPRALAHTVERGLPVITHGVALSLGGAQKPERARIERLARVAQVLRSPLVSEHVAFCRAGGIESPHFMPVPHTRAQLAVLVDNVHRVMDALPVPLALENVAAPLRWPGDELAEADFLAELLARTGALLLLDVANLHANLVNFGGDLDAYLDRLPLDRIAYLHVAGGARVETLWRDTHAHPVTAEIVDTLDRVLARTGPRPLLLERDHHYGTRSALEAELDLLAARLACAGPASHVQRRETIELPRIDRGARAALETQHVRLFRGDADFDPTQLAEMRSIVSGKSARMLGACPSSTTS